MMAERNLDRVSVSSQDSQDHLTGSLHLDNSVAFHRLAKNRTLSEPLIDCNDIESSYRDTSPVIRFTRSVDSQLGRLSRTSMPSALIGQGRAKTAQERYIDASVYIQEGEDNDKFTTHPTTQGAMTGYRLIHNHVAWTLDLIASILILVISIAEYPSVFLEKDTFNFSSHESTHYLDDFYLPFHTVIEVACLSVVLVLLLFRMKWMGVRHFFRHFRSVLKLFLIGIMYVEVIVILIRFRNHIRVFRALRPVFLLDSHYCRGVRRMARQILQSMPPILDMMLLLIAFILVFALFGYFLFIDAKNSIYFVDLWTSFVSLFILLTTANFPTVMMPVYSEYWWAPIFFIAFLCIGLYLIMNLLLAVVYSTFSTFEKEKFRKLFLHKREALCRAFDVIHGSQNMNFEQFSGLMKVHKPHWNNWRVLCCFKALDKDNSNSLCLQEFLHFYEVINMKWIQYSDLEGEARWYSWIKTKRIRKFFRGITIFVEHKIFKYIINFSLICFGIFLIYVAAETGAQPESVNVIVNGTNVSLGGRCIYLNKENTVYWINVFFLALYSIEAVLKLVGLGLIPYFSHAWNVFDFLCVLLSAVGMTVDLANYKSLPLYEACSDGHSAKDWLRYVLYARVIRLFRLFQIKQRYRDVLGTLFALLPRMFNVGLLIILLYFFFAIIGMECFSFLLYPGCCTKYWTPGFDVQSNYNGNTTYPDQHTYFLNNFNNILRSYVLLFELMIVNNWYIAMNAVTAESGTQWTRLYFMIFFIVSVIIVAIVISFILDAFLFRMESYDNARGQVFGEGVDTKDVYISKDEYQQFCQKLPNLINENGSWMHLRYKGKRKKTKADFRLQMYADEAKEWAVEQDAILERERSTAATRGPLATLTHDRMLPDGPDLVENHFSNDLSVSVQPASVVQTE
ncbi:two pore channel protein 1-like [Corticium candelabrum]|uniref:two pore channel protein 1-like n=1 Tax=Corticium candelabrum TaxID=121492 RepID=UPI002E268944|nr:two pore channel protein 1-like [Corticium candelabrum]